jgi:O-succinylbenzoate synthase
MQLRRIVLREIRMPLLVPFETSFGRTTERRILLVEADCGGATGWGEVTAGETPFYSPETADTAWLILRDFLWPLLQGREFQSASQVWDILGRVRGNNMAKGGLEAAIWDAEARAKGVPLWQHIGGTRDAIPCGVSIGIRPSLDDLVATVERELASGYQRIKVKIKPGYDLEPIARLRERFPAVRLMADANSAYTEKDFPLLDRLDAFHLMMIEQPLGWDDIHAHAALQKRLKTAICLDECIHTIEHARAAIELAACRIVNVKLGRVGGYTAAKAIHDLCAAHSIPVWCGGMLESGIGRAHNIALSTLSNFSLPGDVSASRRYWEEDIIDPEVEVTPRGTIRVPAGPGIGFAPRLDRIEKLTVRKETLAATASR